MSETHKETAVNAQELELGVLTSFFTAIFNEDLSSVDVQT